MSKEALTQPTLLERGFINTYLHPRGLVSGWAEIHSFLSRALPLSIHYRRFQPTLNLSQAFSLSVQYGLSPLHQAQQRKFRPATDGDCKHGPI